MTTVHGSLLALVLNVALASIALGAQVTFPAQDRASGVSWNWEWSNPNQVLVPDPQCLIAGMRSMDPLSGTEDTSTQLRFDVRALSGYYVTINSATIRLTQHTNFWAGVGPGTLKLFRLSPANARWNGEATWGYLDGTISNPWAGGVSGARIPAIDYKPTLLASAPFQLTTSGEGTMYDLVVPGSIAAQFISQWASGGVNEGFLLYADGSPDGDNRILFHCDGLHGPQLIVDYTPNPAVALSITQEPTSTTVVEHGSARFAVTATGAPPLRYCWLRDGVAVAAATNREYTLGSVQLSDHGSHFSVQVVDAANNAGASRAAVLAVLPNTEPPALLAATNIADNRVLARFSKPLSANTARVTGNYEISGDVKVLAAELGTDGTTVLLTTGPIPHGTSALRVRGLRDTTAAANQVVSGSAATFVRTAKAVFPTCNRASGVSWDKAFSNPNQESHLAVGEWFGPTSTQLRFDVSGLHGRYRAINSARLRLTLGYHGVRPHWWYAWLAKLIGGRLELYRVSAANAAWNDQATFGTIDGTNAWAGGASGALNPGVDYVTNLLARGGYSNRRNGAAAAGTVCELVIPGTLAKPLLDDWCSGRNEGFLLRADPAGADNHGIFVQDGPDAPQLI
ncbi:MAG TPA: immunoglobulin domain-containing protein, partial [Dongiaceae bacterium]|nr:immunoglobulin domain-containing protein [Dongiaceae bacterium]